MLPVAAMAPLLVAAGAIFLFTGMDAIIKGLPAGLTIVQIVAMRFTFAVPPALLMAWRARALSGHTAWRANGLRGVLVLGTCALFFFALRRLPFAETLALSFLAPLFMVLLAAALLGERLRLKVLGAVAVGFAGVAVILSGGLSAAGTDRLGAAAAMGAAVCYAGSMILLRRQAQRDRPEMIVLIQQVVPAVLTLPLALADWTPQPPLMWAAFMLLGTLGVGGQFLLTWAYARAPTGALAVMEYTALPWAALIGFAVFGEVPTATVLLGGALILGACLAVTRLRR
ncbi:MAG: DMT family transporter [Rhodospirillales bacterium]|nr:DMT family transporter [Rhodospirillales bacterium]